MKRRSRAQPRRLAYRPNPFLSGPSRIFSPIARLRRIGLGFRVAAALSRSIRTNESPEVTGSARIEECEPVSRRLLRQWRVSWRKTPEQRRHARWSQPERDAAVDPNPEGLTLRETENIWLPSFRPNASQQMKAQLRPDALPGAAILLPPQKTRSRSGSLAQLGEEVPRNRKSIAGLLDPVRDWVHVCSKREGGGEMVHRCRGSSLRSVPGGIGEVIHLPGGDRRDAGRRKRSSTLEVHLTLALPPPDPRWGRDGRLKREEASACGSLVCVDPVMSPIVDPSPTTP